ncbi:hypothetical protein SERLA73DRAFT_145355 [Serpula lacrymans var. lacrymans S7.3]|uniref:Uncharacterized protein n=1 Tax=Serpula lacrymans var. lacrymans (strain S7.3) TaxID=936435 RepID=F8QDK9_SERL3|nr:hypothetical protein SERLA73DRAFT_145355 [Serpula lacrymans var. lacrymans S7.3]
MRQLTLEGSYEIPSTEIETKYRQLKYCQTCELYSFQTICRCLIATCHRWIWWRYEAIRECAHCRRYTARNKKDRVKYEKYHEYPSVTFP